MIRAAWPLFSTCRPLRAHRSLPTQDAAKLELAGLRHVTGWPGRGDNKTPPWVRDAPAFSPSSSRRSRLIASRLGALARGARPHLCPSHLTLAAPRDVARATNLAGPCRLSRLHCHEPRGRTQGCLCSRQRRRELRSCPLPDNDTGSLSNNPPPRGSSYGRRLSRHSLRMIFKCKASLRLPALHVC